MVTCAAISPTSSTSCCRSSARRAAVRAAPGVDGAPSLSTTPACPPEHGVSRPTRSRTAFPRATPGVDTPVRSGSASVPGRTQVGETSTGSCHACSGTPWARRSTSPAGRPDRCSSCRSRRRRGPSVSGAIDPSSGSPDSRSSDSVTNGVTQASVPSGLSQRSVTGASSPTRPPSGPPAAVRTSTPRWRSPLARPGSSGDAGASSSMTC